MRFWDVAHCKKHKKRVRDIRVNIKLCKYYISLAYIEIRV